MRRALAGSIVLLTTLTGCATTNTKPIDDAHNASVREENAKYSTWQRYSSCDHAPKGATCGLVADDMESDEYQARFVSRVCHVGSGDAIPDGCIMQFADTFIARLAERYPAADWALANQYCDAHPEHCTSLRERELVVLASHNAALEKMHEERLEQLAGERDEQIAKAEAEATERRRLALKALAAGMQGFSDGMNGRQSAPTTSPSYTSKQSPTTMQTTAPDSCTSDYSCGPGRACVKNQFEATGTCAQTVNQYGVQTFAPADPASVGVGHPDQCSFDTDCSIGFHCAKGSGIRGTCLR